MIEFFNATVIPSTIAVAFFVAAYLLGSVSFAVIVSKLYGLQDPRSYGSGNPGATNVLRSGHKTAAVLTLLGDAFKGWLTVWLTINLSASATLVCIAAVGVFIGHLFPIFLAFKGGKGVATAFGVLLALAPTLGIATLLTWLIVAFFFRMSSLAAVAAGVFAPFYYLILAGVLWPFEPAILGALILMGVLLLARHRANIVRILAGTEPKIGKKTT
uniref:glycerol-3-phosphate 1-O-acyltransferase PlsY n=1 Tax=Orrella sp. TaxID=1921583 RepID=UPI00404844F5